MNSTEDSIIGGSDSFLFNSTSNCTENCTENFIFHVAHTSPWTTLVLQFLYGIVCFVGLCGNTLVIYVVVRFSKMQTVTNLYIVNLAIADECFLVGEPFLIATMGWGDWRFGNIMCKVYFTLTSINQITSSMFLLIMSADRYLAVCHPISAPKWRTPLIAKMVALTAWTLSALIMVPIFLYASTLEQDNKINCNIFWPESGNISGETIFIFYCFSLGFAIPLTLILVFYILVIRRLRTVGPKRRIPVANSSNVVVAASPAATPKNCDEAPAGTGGASLLPGPTPQQSIRARDRKKSHRKVTKLVLTVITVYFFCWVPYWATQIVLLYMPQDSVHSGHVVDLFLLAGCLSYSNSAMNPILYAFLSDNFKKSFLKACTCAKGKDVNATLHVENSMFPRGKRASERLRKAFGASGTSAGTSAIPGGKQGNTSNSGGGPSHHLLSVPQPITPTRLPIPPSDLEIESDEEGECPISRCHIDSGYGEESRTSASRLGLISDVTQETFIQDGVHVTAL